MENQKSFAYTYSPKENQEVLSIRSKYLPREETKLDELRRLDRETRRPALVFAWIFGALAALIMGAGMSLVMSDMGAIFHIPNATAAGIVIGVLGLGLAVLTYPLYKAMVNSRSKKYASRIVALSNEIMNQQ